MKQDGSCAGVCMYEKFKLEFQIVYLEYIYNKSIKIEAVCYNRKNSINKEEIFKYSTNNLNSSDERMKVSLSILDSVIKNLDLEKDNLYKLNVKNNEVFYIHKL